MSQINNVNDLGFTPEQLEYFETEMKKYKLPFITKLHKKYGVPFIRYSIVPAILIIVILGIIYYSSSFGRYDWMWTLDKAIAFFYIFGFGGFTLISHICELVSTNKLRKRLDLPKKDFAILVIAFQITGM
jgi:hypothetical protein